MTKFNRYLVLLLLIITTQISYAQKVRITGTVITEKGSHVMVVLNDTVGRLSRSEKPHPKNWHRIFDNKKYVVETSDGRFSIRAKKTDSLLFYSIGHIAQTYVVSDLLKQKNITVALKAMPCKEFVPCNESQHPLFVFVAQKISIKPAPSENYCNALPFDEKYIAKYRIIESVYGGFAKDTIDFIVYDHYGRPEFEKFDTVLLYVAKYCENLVHIKYQFSDVYKTADGRWAAAHNPYTFGYDYVFDEEDEDEVKPEIIKFEKPVVFNANNFSELYCKERFISPYYKKDGNTFIAIYGNYVKDIFRFTKENSLYDFTFPEDE